MDDGEALLRAIRSQPDEDTPRLAYADWLDEQGEDKRAEFLRSHITAAKPEPRVHALRCPLRGLWRQPHARGTGDVGACRRCAWQAANIRLHALMKDSLEQPAPANCSGTLDTYTIGRTTYDRLTKERKSCGLVGRGLLAEVGCPIATFLKHAAGLFANPITAVRLVDRQPGQWPYQMGGEHQPRAGQWWWYLERVGYTLDMRYSHHLPTDLFNRLSGGELDLARSRFYHSLDAAIADLSDACVQFGRAAYANNSSRHSAGSAPTG